MQIRDVLRGQAKHFSRDFVITPEEVKEISLDYKLKG